MSATFKRSFKKNLNHPTGKFSIGKARAEAQNVCVVVKTRQTGALNITCKGGAHTLKFIGGNTHAYTRSTDKYGSIAFSI